MFVGTIEDNFSVQQSVMASRDSNSLLRRCLRIGSCLCATVLVFVLFVAPSNSFAQSKKKKTPRKSEPTLAERSAKARAELIKASKAYKATLETNIPLYERNVREKVASVEKMKVLYEAGVAAKLEVDKQDLLLADAKRELDDVRNKIGETDNLIAEATAEDQLPKLGPGTYQTTAALIRYNGTAQWVLTDAAKVQSFFALRFKQALPISAFGQTAVHDHLGFDHRNSIDVAVSPDSTEGQTLMAYLRSAGIPFIAFRHAVRGSATGAHIHIGYPSRRVSK